MNSKFKQLIAKYAALSLRERLMLFVAGLAIVYAVLNTLLLSPALKKQRVLQMSVAETQANITHIQQQMSALEQSPVMDLNIENKNKIALLEAGIAAQKSELAALNRAFINPEDMPDLLENLMANQVNAQANNSTSSHANIRLVNMKTLPPENIIKTLQAAASPSTEQAAIYKHGMTITLAGDYMSLMAYAEALQHLTKQVLWDKATLQAKAYPLSELTITLYTYSLDATWLSI